MVDFPALSEITNEPPALRATYNSSLPIGPQQDVDAELRDLEAQVGDRGDDVLVTLEE